MRKTFVTVALSFGLFGCVDGDGSGVSARNGEHDDEECGCKIEGSAIGRVGSYVRVGGELIVFEAWTPKPGSPGEYLGFELSANAAGVDYVVKAATSSYAGSGTSWSHPDGDDAHAISNVDFCDEDPPEDPPPPPHDDDGPPIL
jgi:hypothetical protein